MIRVSPRFAVLLAAMCLSVGFIIVDILSVTSVFKASSLPEGINPFWKLAFIFKCLTDTIILDDFKTALDKLKQYKMERLGSSNIGSADGGPNVAHMRRGTEWKPWNESRGVTDMDKPAKKQEDAQVDQYSNIDLEMAYFTRESQDHAQSSKTKSSGSG